MMVFCSQASRCNRESGKLPSHTEYCQYRCWDLDMTDLKRKLKYIGQIKSNEGYQNKLIFLTCSFDLIRQIYFGNIANAYFEQVVKKLIIETLTFKL